MADETDDEQILNSGGDQLEPGAAAQASTAAEPSANDSPEDYASPGGIREALSQRDEVLSTPAEEPVIPHQRWNDPTREQAQLQHDQAQAQAVQAAQYREQSAQVAGIDKYLKSQGVAFDTAPDGSQSPAYHTDESGNPVALKFKPAVISPAQWIDNPDDAENGGYWGKLTRDDRGATQTLDLLKEGVAGKDYHRDSANGEYFVEQPGGDRQWLGQRDEVYLDRRNTEELDQLAQAGIGAATARMAELRQMISTRKVERNSGENLNTVAGLPPDLQQKELQSNDEKVSADVAAVDSAKNGWTSMLPGGSSRLAAAQTQLAQDQKLRESNRAAVAQDKELQDWQQEHDRLGQQVTQTRAALANRVLNSRVMNYAMTHNVDPDSPDSAALNAFVASFGAGGTAAGSMAKYPNEAIETADDGTRTVKPDFLLSRAASIAAMNGKSVTDSLPIALKEAKAQGLTSPTFADQQQDLPATDPIAKTQAALAAGKIDPAQANKAVRQISGAQDFGARTVGGAAASINSSIAGICRFFGATDATDYFDANARLSQQFKEKYSDRSKDNTWAGTAGDVAGDLLAMTPTMVVGGAVGGAWKGASLLAKIAKSAVGMLPMGIQGAAEAGDAAWNQAKQTGKSDEEANTAATGAALKTLPGLALYGVAGAGAGKILKAATPLLPALETPWGRALGAVAVNTPLNMAASATARAVEGENPLDFSKKGFATDLAFAGLGGLHAFSAAKFLSTARAMAEGSHPEVAMLKGMANDQTATPEVRKAATQQVQQLQTGARSFLNELGAKPAVQHAEAIDILNASDGMAASATKLDAQQSALSRANFALNKMVATQPDASMNAARPLIDVRNEAFAREVMKPSAADDPRSAVLVRIGKIAQDSGAVSQQQIDSVRQALSRSVPPENLEAAVNHAVGTAVCGDTLQRVLGGKALTGNVSRMANGQKVDANPVNRAYVATLAKAGVAHIEPDMTTSLNLPYAFLFPAGVRERVAKNPANFVHVPEDSSMGDVRDAIREGHAVAHGNEPVGSTGVALVNEAPRSTAAEASAQAMLSAENAHNAELQSPQAAVKLREKLLAEQKASQVARDAKPKTGKEANGEPKDRVPAPNGSVPIPEKSAAESAQAIENALSTEERLRQSAAGGELLRSDLNRRENTGEGLPPSDASANRTPHTPEETLPKEATTPVPEPVRQSTRPEASQEPGKAAGETRGEDAPGESAPALPEGQTENESAETIEAEVLAPEKEWHSEIIPDDGNFTPFQIENMETERLIALAEDTDLIAPKDNELILRELYKRHVEMSPDQLRDGERLAVQPENMGAAGGAPALDVGGTSSGATQVPRATTVEEEAATAKASPVLALDRTATGWRAIHRGDTVTLVSQDGKKALDFTNPKPDSGSEWARTQALAQAYAIDHPYEVQTPKGELVTKPLHTSNIPQEAGKEPVANEDHTPPINSEIPSPERKPGAAVSADRKAAGDVASPNDDAQKGETKSQAHKAEVENLAELSPREAARLRGGFPLLDPYRISGPDRFIDIPPEELTNQEKVHLQAVADGRKPITSLNISGNEGAEAAFIKAAKELGISVDRDITGQLTAFSNRDAFNRLNNALKNTKGNSGDRFEKVGRAFGYKSHKELVAEAVDSRKPVNASSVFEYRIKLPDEYLRDGDRFIYKTSSKENLREVAVEHPDDELARLESQAEDHLQPVSHTVTSNKGRQFVKRGDTWFSVDNGGNESAIEEPGNARFLESKKMPVKGEAIKSGNRTFSKSGNERSYKTTAEQAQGVVDFLSKRLPNAPEVRVLGSHDALSELPPEVREAYRRDGVEGFFDPKTGRVTLIANKLATPSDVARVYAHEVTGHYGVHAVLGKGYDRAMDLATLESAGKVAEMAKTRRLDLRDPAQRRTAAAEYIAKVAETNEHFLPKTVNFVKDALKKVFAGVTFKDDVVRGLLKDSARYLRGEIPAGNGDGVNVEKPLLMARPEVGLTLKDVGKDFPQDDVAPRLLDIRGTPSQAAMRAAEEFNRWPDSMVAADGSQIHLKNPEQGSLGKRINHLIASKPPGSELRKFAPDKAKWMPMVPETLKDAAVRLVDSETGNRIYVRQYNTGEKHMVIVEPDGRVIEQKGFKGALITQLRDNPSSKRAGFEIDYVNPRYRTGPGRSQGNPRPAPADSTRPDTRQPEFRSQNTAVAEKTQDGNVLFSKGDTKETELAKKANQAFAMGPRINDPTKSLLERGGKLLKRTFMGFADVLENTKGLEGLGKKVRNHIDRQREWEASTTRNYGRLMEAEGERRFKAAEKEVEKFYQAADRGENREGLFNKLSPEGKAHVEAWRRVANFYGDISDRLNVQVQDADGKWRKAARPEDYHPRMIRRDLLNAIADPTGNRKAWVEAYKIMSEGGMSHEQIVQLVRDYRDISANDYFANVEKARGLKLPDAMYDYSLEARLRYIRGASERLAQIEQYGQKTGKGTKDVFDEAIESTADQRTQEYLAAGRDQVYGVRRKGPVYRTMAILNSLATMTQLGNWSTSLVNLGSGLAHNAATLGIRNTVMGVLKGINLRKLTAEAKEAGVLGDDMLGLVDDAARIGSNRVETMNKLTATALKIGGYNATEVFVRATGMASARLWLKSALKTQAASPDSRAARLNEAFIRRNHVDPQKIWTENGKGPETDRLYRMFLNAAQGGYKIDQTPIYQNTELGKFLFKYQKWGAQALRNFDLNILQPALGVPPESAGRKVSLGVRAQYVDMKPLLRYAVALGGMGALLSAAKSAVFGTPDRTASMAEIANTWDDDERRALALLASKIYTYQMVSGFAGMAGNYSQALMDFTERSRFKNPMEPPGLAVAANAGEQVMRLIEQGKLTADDLNDYLKSQVSLYRTAVGVAGRTGISQEEKIRQNISWLNSVSKRYADELGIPQNRTSIGRFGKNENSPLLQNLKQALLTGDTSTARVLSHKFVGQDPRHTKDRLEALKHSVEASQPIRVGSAGEARRELFLRWAKNRLSPEEFQTIQSLDLTYRRSAMALGLMSGKRVTQSQIQTTLRKIESRK